MIIKNKIKQHISFSLSMLLTLMGVFFLGACSHDNEDFIEQDNFIRIAPSILETRTKIVGSNFETNDQIGLYIVPFTNSNNTAGSIGTNNYASNLKHVFNGKAWSLDNGSKISWPNPTSKIDIYAYSPYDSNLSGSNPTAYSFTVKTDQQTKLGYNASDFLWAKSVSTAPTTSAIDLSFSHRLSKVKVNIKSEIDLSADEIKNAIVKIRNTKGTGIVNLQNGQVTPQEGSLVDILPLRYATPVTGYDISVEGIIIPQTLSIGSRLVDINFDTNRIGYVYDMDAALTFESGKERTINLTITQTGMTVTVGEIKDWQPAPVVEGNIDQSIGKAMDLSKIDWNKSLVHNVYDASGYKVAIVVKEYLSLKTATPQTIDNQAIVIYPVDANENPLLNRGFVAQVMSNTINNTTYEYDPLQTNVHGGAVSWNTSTNAVASYTAGNLPLINKVELTSGSILRATADNYICRLTISPDLVTDIDNNTYRVVKTGTQYWTLDNLKVERYRNGVNIPHYYYSNNPIYKDVYGTMYNWNAVADANEIAPEGWHLPTKAELETLNKFGGSAATNLKHVGSWSIMSTNNTGYGMLPGGLMQIVNTFESFSGIALVAYVWTSTPVSTTSTSAYAMRIYNSGTVDFPSFPKVSAFYVRLIKNN
ncbi:fimbrillin family protein [Dysgonomonas sp. HGC4]|uniref:fimbrillin family protein n=1 Tax=Dysgonomonas sp. HGC4 TaxID=1658009 RepID=UPI000681F1D5|nr:fimbrillin family protein [Dysgonomonas sp. HGC4]MBD8346713.1 fimbrillin family protein [Dysgonomonas sp. HGC4]